MKLAMRLLGLVLLAFSPVLALYALWVFRRSRKPKDHSYFHNLRELARESWKLAVTGELP